MPKRNKSERRKKRKSAHNKRNRPTFLNIAGKIMPNTRYEPENAEHRK